MDTTQGTIEDTVKEWFSFGTRIATSYHPLIEHDKGHWLVEILKVDKGEPYTLVRYAWGKTLNEAIDNVTRYY